MKATKRLQEGGQKMMKDDLADLPLLEPAKRILITGASGDIGRETLRLFTRSEALIGAHYSSGATVLSRVVSECQSKPAQIKLFQADFNISESSQKLVHSFVDWAGGIDVLVQLSGGVSNPVPWDQLTEKEWNADLNLNLTSAFFMAQTAMKYMHESGGKIILMSTASVMHGGGRMSMAYGVAKAGIECLTKGLAREGAPYKILVNAICPGFIDTTFHTKRMKRTTEELRRRAELVLLKRAGTPLEVAAMILFLTSRWGDFITGACIPISGGDWL